MTERVELRTIRTSDRSSFRRCRRKWALTSHLRDNLEQATQGPAAPLWLGTAVHFALEDYHGLNSFGDPVKAFDAFPEFWKKEQNQLMPVDSDELMDLGRKMIQYYKLWDKVHGSEYTTWIHEGKPQVEVTFEIKLTNPLTGELFLYKGRFDRIAIDNFEQLWIMDYKTTKRHPSKQFLNIDSQAAAYTWAGTRIFGRAFAGVVFLHLLKEEAKAPEHRVGFVSVNKSMKTSAIMYKRALKVAFPDGEIPEQNAEFLANMEDDEDDVGDRYCKLTEVVKTPGNLENEEMKIMAESIDMLNDELPLYPNPTWTCSWDCPVMTICMEMDDNGDVDDLIKHEFQKRAARPEAWFAEEEAIWRNG